MQIQIQPMTRETVPGVAALERSCFTQPWSEEAFYAELDNSHAVTLVAVADSVAGFVNARNLFGDVYINNIAVAEAFRRRKIAERLLLALEERIKPFIFITLEVRKSNLPAQKLYEKMGYAVAGERKGFYSSPAENALLMTKFGSMPEPVQNSKVEGNI